MSALGRLIVCLAAHYSVVSRRPRSELIKAKDEAVRVRRVAVAAHAAGRANIRSDQRRMRRIGLAPPPTNQPGHLLPTRDDAAQVLVALQLHNQFFALLAHGFAVALLCRLPSSFRSGDLCHLCLLVSWKKCHEGNDFDLLSDILSHALLQ